MLNDIRHALRLLVRNPGFSLVACATLALGIGATTAIFSVVDAAVFRPLPYKDADRLVYVNANVLTRGGGYTLIAASGRRVEELRALKQVFDGVEAFSDPQSRALETGSDASPSVGALAPTLPGFLGVSPQLGRGFTSDDVTRKDAIIISDGYWQRAFNRDRNVLGKTIAFADGTASVVIGVMPPTFRYFVGARTDAWLPLVERDGGELVARIRPGLTVEGAQHELNMALGQGVAGQPPRLVIEAAEAYREDRSTSTMLFSLLGAVGFVLLIACANVANMLLSRTLTRQREIAVRGALGATAGRLVRQFLIEGLVLAGLGGLAAAALAWCGIMAIPAIVPEKLIRAVLGVSLPSLDLRVLAFGVFAAVLTGVLCGAMPAVRAARSASADGLLSGGQRVAGSSRGQRRVRDAFQALQVAMTLVLLAGAGLLISSFLRMATAPPGFDPENLGYALLAFPQNAYGQPQRVAFLDELIARLAEVPGIKAATAGASPVAGYAGQLFIPERADGPAASAVPLEMFYVRPDYFHVAGIPLKEGRTFGPEDGPNTPRVAIISENAARRFWPGHSAIGQRFRRNAAESPVTVIGVAPHVKTINVARDGVEAYFPEVQASVVEARLLMRVSGDPTPALPAVRAAVHAVDPKVTVVRIGMVNNLFAEFDPIGSSRFYAVLLGTFAGIGVLTAAVGLYGLLSYSVSRRTREIGVRIALGAGLSRVRWLIVADVLVPIAVGIAAGIVAATWLTRFIASQLFQVTPHDPLTFAVVVMLFLGVCVIAVLVPVRRATRIDPAEALRAE